MKPHSLTIRLATRADVADIAAMSRDEIERGLGWSWTEPRVARAVASADTNVIVAGAPGAIAGFGIMSYAEEHAHLMLFAVAAAHRRQRVGSGMLEWLERVARDAGMRTIRVECRRTNEAARNFYGEHGYEEVAINRGYYQRVEDAVGLQKHLFTKTDPSPDPSAPR
ncbi:MAG TPA: N-acetyltransferase [Steroidobacteraceae bacterium]|nr:N-acetyltransferase [Steroidobacteraceae bacterium]